MFKNIDIAQFAAKGICADIVTKQIEFFKKGFPFLPIVRAAIVGDGVKYFDDKQTASLINEYNKTSKNISIVKFVPASGAATRMFKEYFEFVNDNKQAKVIEESLKRISDFAFYDELNKNISKNSSDKEIISAIINDGLGYGKLPKGLILFHSYQDSNRTALEEHLAEGAMYAISNGNTVNIHFTVSPEHQAGFETQVSEKIKKYEDNFGVKFNVSYSQQKPKTDTVAVDMDNEPFREDDGSILFRPGGHGALLENLNDIDADIIFIKNIDNVVPDHLKADTVEYKKVIAGLLLKLRSQCYEYMNILDGKADSDIIDEIKEFVESELCYKLSGDFSDLNLEDKIDTLRSIINRPIRVCGMVKSEGEPGGGPFWVKDDNGSIALQIAESSQISPAQQDLMRGATHFNPVDLVCSVKDYKGKKYDLTQYFDPKTGFISIKSKNGKELKAQELPGLWNGAMANWNTIFVEVPISTFNPVKSVIDLLRPQHQ